MLMATAQAQAQEQGTRDANIDTCFTGVSGADIENFTQAIMVILSCENLWEMRNRWCPSTISSASIPGSFTTPRRAKAADRNLVMHMNVR